MKNTTTPATTKPTTITVDGYTFTLTPAAVRSTDGRTAECLAVATAARRGSESWLVATVTGAVVAVLRGEPGHWVVQDVTGREGAGYRLRKFCRVHGDGTWLDALAAAAL